MIFEAESPLCGPRIGFLNYNNDILDCGKGQILLLSGVAVSIFLYKIYPYEFYSNYLDLIENNFKF